MVKTHAQKEWLTADFTIEVIIALEPGQKPTRAWWASRCQRADTKAGGMPAEIRDPAQVKLRRETDPDSGERYLRAFFPLPAGTSLGRARELSHLLASMLMAEGYTLREDGRRQDTIPGDTEPDGSLGPDDLRTARVYANRCLGCIFASETRLGCCTEGAAFSLADLGAMLLAGDEEFVAKVLALPGERDDTKWRPYLKAGICLFHDPACGCTLPVERMPLQCRTYLCAPDMLLPAPVAADYPGYVAALEEAETFLEDHMYFESGVDFKSSLPELKAAAAKAFAAWKRN